MHALHALEVLRTACIAPGAMEREQRYLRALATVATVRLEGTTLELRGTDGSLAVQAVREGDD